MSVDKMSYKELYLKWEMCLEKIEEQEEEIKSLIIQRERDQAALKLISAGLGVLDCMATVAKPSEFETLFKDFLFEVKKRPDFDQTWVRPASEFFDGRFVNQDLFTVEAPK